MHKKLFVSTVVVILLTLLLSFASINLVVQRQFQNYLTNTTEAMIAQLPERLAAIYEKTGYWDLVWLEDLSYSLPLETEVTLMDNQGQVISTFKHTLIDSSDTTLALMDMVIFHSLQKWRSKTVDIVGQQGHIGTAVISYPISARILNPQDLSFVYAIILAQLFAGGLALLIGVILSYRMSRRLVYPLQQLTRAAERIGEGNLKDYSAQHELAEKLPVSTNDEVGHLALAFKSMANNLASQEQLRKQFTADLAHEVATPLTTIRSYIEAFEDGILSPDKENVASLHEEIDRLEGLVADLKDLNIAEMGYLKLNLMSVDLGKILNKLVHNFQPLLAGKNLTLSWTDPGDPIYIEGDERLLTRLFYNLIHNAYKYTDWGGEIKVAVSRKDAVQVMVQDNGIGIPEEDQPFIFERFYRADKSRTRETGGSGIGLALVRQIVLLHGGDIEVRSKVGEGSVFTVTFPRPEHVLE